jgi:hypothetical protein
LKATNISNETTKPACYECYDYCAPFACSASGWNTPTHMVTGAIAYRTLESESPRTVSVIQTLLEKHPWDADRWRDNVEKLPESQRGEMLFMLAARWADDIRAQANLQREVRWHYINFPFKPTGEPEEIKPLLPARDNILVGRLSKIATELPNKFSRVGLRELDQRLPKRGRRKATMS